MGDLPELMEIQRGGHTLVGYPALVDAGDAVTLQVFDSPEKARELHRAGVLRLLAIAFRDRIRDIERSLAKDVVLGPLKADVVAAALARTFLARRGADRAGASSRGASTKAAAGSRSSRRSWRAPPPASSPSAQRSRRSCVAMKTFPAGNGRREAANRPPARARLARAHAVGAPAASDRAT